MKQILVTAIYIFLILGSGVPTETIYAQGKAECNFPGECLDGCTYDGECINNYKCIVDPGDPQKFKQSTLRLSTQVSCNSSKIGGVSPPVGAGRFNNSSSGGTEGEGIGIILFISNLLKVFAIVCGIWAMFNILMGGYTYITSMSDAGATEKVKNSITMTVIGLAIIAGAYTIAGVIGLIMFGNAGFILNPQLYSAVQ